MTQYWPFGPRPFEGQVGEVLSLAESPGVLPLISLERGSPLWGWATPLSEDPELSWTATTSHPRETRAASRGERVGLGQCGAVSQ